MSKVPTVVKPTDYLTVLFLDPLKRPLIDC